MSKKKPQQNKVIIYSELSQEELIQAIVNAQFQIENNKEEERRKAKEEWRKKVGYREDLGKVRTFSNRVGCLFRLLVFPEKYADENDVKGTVGLMILFLSEIFWFAEICCFVLPIGYIIYSFVKFDLDVSKVLLYLISAIFFIMLSRLFRLSRYEVENLKDNNYIFMIFTAVVTFIAMLFTVVAAIKR